MGYVLYGQAKGKRLFSTLQCRDWLWAPPSLLSNEYWRLEADNPSASNTKAKNDGAILPLAIHLHSMVLNEVQGLHLLSYISLTEFMQVFCMGPTVKSGNF
jgi:hypothetical protein